MAAQAGLCLAWSETPEYMFCRVVAHILTCKDHAHLKTLLEATELAAIPIGFVDLAAAIAHTSIHSLVLDCSFEEAFATAKYSVYTL